METVIFRHNRYSNLLLLFTVYKLLSINQDCYQPNLPFEWHRFWPEPWIFLNDEIRKITAATFCNNIFTVLWFPSEAVFWTACVIIQAFVYLWLQHNKRRCIAHFRLMIRWTGCEFENPEHQTVFTTNFHLYSNGCGSIFAWPWFDGTTCVPAAIVHTGRSDSDN